MCNFFFALLISFNALNRSMQLNYIPVSIDRFIFRSNVLWMRLPWECHDQSQDTNWRHCVTGPELPFFHKRKGVLKIDQSVKMPWLSMGVASSWSSASVSGIFLSLEMRFFLLVFGPGISEFCPHSIMSLQILTSLKDLLNCCIWGVK